MQSEESGNCTEPSLLHVGCACGRHCIAKNGAELIAATGEAERFLGVPNERAEHRLDIVNPLPPPAVRYRRVSSGPKQGPEWTTPLNLTRGEVECLSAREDAPGTPEGTSSPTASLSGEGGWVRHFGSRIPTPHRPHFTEGEVEDRLSQVGRRALPAGGAGETQVTDSAPVWCGGRVCHSQRTPFSVSPACVAGAAGRDFSRYGARGQGSDWTPYLPCARAAKAGAFELGVCPGQVLPIGRLSAVRLVDQRLRKAYRRKRRCGDRLACSATEQTRDPDSRSALSSRQDARWK